MKTTAQNFITEFIRKAKERNRRHDFVHTANSVTLKKRFRDFGQGDMLGVFSPQNMWTPISNPNYYTMNIVKPMVRANGAAVESANVEVEIEPRFPKDSKAMMAADVARGIVELKESEQWTSSLEKRICFEPQLASGVFLKTTWDASKPNRCKSSLTEWDESDMNVAGSASCAACGYQQGVDQGEYGQQMQCTNCGGHAMVTQEPQSQKVSVMVGVKEVKTGNSTTQVIPAAEILIDERDTQSGNIAAARWLIHRYWRTAGELKIKHPNYNGATNTEFSFALKWQYILATGQDDISRMTGLEDSVEVFDVYLTPQMYAHVELDDNFFLASKDGKMRYAAPAGGGFADGMCNDAALESMPTLCFTIAGGQILDVYPCDFKEEFTYISMLPDPSAFWGLFLTEMLSLQDIVNYMLTIWVMHARRNARTTLVLNRDAYDPADVEKDIVMTREGVPWDIPINQTYGYIPPAPFSADPINLIKTVLETKGDIGGVTPPMVGGDGSGYDTFSGQLLAKNQAMAQLTPFSTSKANAKVQWALQQLRLAQQYWTEEDFLFLLKMNSEWTEEHIECFMESDIESDFIVDYKSGSEVPTSLLEREMKLRQFLGDLMQIAQVNPAILTPQTISSVLTRMQEYSNIDLDVLNSTDEIVLADKRFAIIKQMTEGIPVPSNPNPMILDKASTSITSFIGLIPYVRENHDLHIAYWIDRIRQENTQDHPNYFRIACYDKMVYLHEQMKVKAAQEQQTDQMNANAPMMQAQAQAAQAQAQTEAQSQLAVQGQILQGKAQMEEIRQQAKSQMQDKKEQSIAQREEMAHDRLQGDQRAKFQMDQEAENNNFQRDRAAAQQDFANDVGHTILQAGLNKNNGNKSNSSKTN